MEDDTWKDNFYATALQQGNVKQTTVVNGQIVNLTEYQATANRYELGASAGYKFDERSYLVGAVRYENDDFSPFDYQVWPRALLGYGYGDQNSRTELSFEVGPGHNATNRSTAAATAKPWAATDRLQAPDHRHHPLSGTPSWWKPARTTPSSQNDALAWW